MRADITRLVGDNNHSAIVAFFKKLVLAAFLEAVVAHGHHFVDEIAIELDDHGECKGKAGAHAGGVGLDGFVDIAAQLGKILHVGNLVADRGVVDAADEAEVVHAGERALKSAREGEWPRNAHTAMDLAAGGPLGAADNADQGGLTCPVAAEDADFLARANAEVDIVQHGAFTSVDGIPLGDVS